MSIVRLLLVSLALSATVACGGYSSPSSPTAPSGAAAGASQNGPSASVTIPRGAEVLGRNAFNPDELTVAAGTTVTWTNTDTVSHTSTSDVSGWNSGIVAPGQQFSFAFQAAGTYSYHCAIHPGMVGTVVVR